MASRSRRAARHMSPSNSSSTSTSPERDVDDDNDSLMLQPNESTSSIALSMMQEMSDSEAARLMAERQRLSPISRLPAELMIAIFSKLSGSPSDLKSCMLVSKDWARNSVALLWHRPQTTKWSGVNSVARSIMDTNGYFDYASLVRRLNLSNLASDVSDGTLHPLRGCKRIERLTLTNCGAVTDASLSKLIDGNRCLLALDVTGLEKITDKTMNVVANNCARLQGLNVTNCRKLTDDSLAAVARKCRHVKRLKFNGCAQLTEKSILVFAEHCRQILEIDLHGCSLLEDDAVTALVAEGRHLRELRLAHCSRITDQAFLRLPMETTYESLRILDLTDCGELQDAGVAKIIAAAPRLRNLVLAKCRNLTDRAVQSITKLGKNLHYIHLGHCARITDAGVLQLVKLCNRIRYIDLACCVLLTDNSVQQLATLPKLKRIGLVKCGNITDRSILALATKSRQIPVVGPSSLERVHLSYCTNLTLTGIHALLNSCPRLTHLSLTGVQAFLREDLLVFCREAPPEFNDHQRDVFCVFSGLGVGRLRTYLNSDQPPGSIPRFEDGTIYEPDQLDDVDDDDADRDDDDEHDTTALGLFPAAAGTNGPIGNQPYFQGHMQMPLPDLGPPLVSHTPDMVINVGGSHTPSPFSTSAPTPQPPVPPPPPTIPSLQDQNTANWHDTNSFMNGAQSRSGSPLASPPILIQSNNQPPPPPLIHATSGEPFHPTRNNDPTAARSSTPNSGPPRDVVGSSSRYPHQAAMPLNDYEISELIGAVAMQDAEMPDAEMPGNANAQSQAQPQAQSSRDAWFSRWIGGGGRGNSEGGTGADGSGSGNASASR